MNAVATVALVNVATSATAPAKPAPQKSNRPLLPSGKYLLAYGLQAEHSCSQSFEEHGANGELSLDIDGENVTVKIDDRFSRTDGPSRGRYQHGSGGSFQRDEHERHMSFTGKQSADGAHVRVDFEGGMSLVCTIGEIELSPTIDPTSGAEAPHGQVLKGFHCAGASKLLDPVYDRFHETAETLSFMPSIKLSLSGHDMGMSTAWVRLEIAP